MDRKSLPLVYSCSGCSSAAQVANSVAVRLDRQGVAEMSCIAGVGGDVSALLRVAKSKRPIYVLDGCALQCARGCLARHDIEPNMAYVLGEHGVRKVQHGDPAPDDVEKVFNMVKGEILTRAKG